MTPGLCIDCGNNSSCIWSNNAIIICNEYSSLLPETIFKTNADTTEKNDLKKLSYDGICGNCDHLAHCQLKTKNSQFIYCEEYQ